VGVGGLLANKVLVSFPAVYCHSAKTYFTLAFSNVPQAISGRVTLHVVTPESFYKLCVSFITITQFLDTFPWASNDCLVLMSFVLAYKTLKTLRNLSFYD